MKKVLFFVSSFRAGGAERVISVLSKSLSEIYDITIVVLDDDNIAYSHGGKLLSLGIPKSHTLIEKLINFYRKWNRLRKIKKEFQPDVSISFLEGANPLNILTGHNHKTVISIRQHWFGVITQFSFLLGQEQKIMRFLYNKADAALLPSLQLAHKFSEKFHFDFEKITVIHNPYDIELIQEQSCEPLEPELTSIFKNQIGISVARVQFEKGQYHLIRIFNKIKETCPDFKLIILGKITPLKDYINKLAEASHLNLYWQDEHEPFQNITEDYDILFLGVQKNPFKFIKRSTVFVLPSIIEGFPNALVEAMSVGIPIVSADCLTGPREILAPSLDVHAPSVSSVTLAEYGILTPRLKGQYPDPLDPLNDAENELIKGVTTLLQNPALCERYTRDGLKRSYDFHHSKITQQWNEFIQKNIE